MVKLTILYGEPKDSAAFEKYYAETHVPEFGMKIPSVIKVDVGKAITTGESKPAYYRTADLWFKDQATMDEALASPAGKAAVADLPNFATGGYKVFVSEVRTVEFANTAV